MPFRFSEIPFAPASGRPIACILVAFATAGSVFAVDKAAPSAAPVPAKAAEAFPAGWFYPDRSQAVIALEGKTLPKVDLSKAAWGRDKMPDMEGKIVVIDVSTLGCAPCTAAMPHNTALYKECAKDGLVVMGLCFGGSEKAMRQFEKKHGVEYPTAFADVIRDDIKKAWQSPWFPFYIVVDRKGVVRGAGLQQAGATQMAKALLKEQPAK